MILITKDDLDAAIQWILSEGGGSGEGYVIPTPADNITTIELVPKSTDNTGTIILKYESDDYE